LKISVELSVIQWNIEGTQSQTKNKQTGFYSGVAHAHNFWLHFIENHWTTPWIM